MKNLTDKQKKIYDYIVDCHVGSGFPPTQAEIQRHFGFKSINAVRSHLVLIEKKGYIKLNFGKARGIKLTPAPSLGNSHRETSIPLLGSIAAGIPILAEQNIEDYLMMSPSLFGGGDLFALHVLSESMNGVGINNGDIAVIRKEVWFETGQIVATLIGNDATLNRVFFNKDFLVLKSENPNYEDITCHKDQNDNIRVLGLYMGLIRMGNTRYCL